MMLGEILGEMLDVGSFDQGLNVLAAAKYDKTKEKNPAGSHNAKGISNYMTHTIFATDTHLSICDTHAAKSAHTTVNNLDAQKFMFAYTIFLLCIQNILNVHSHFSNSCTFFENCMHRN